MIVLDIGREGTGCFDIVSCPFFSAIICDILSVMNKRTGNGIVMEKQQLKISVRNLVEFIFRSGDLDNRRSGKADMEAMQKGSRLHRKIQGRMDTAYLAEQSLVHEVDCGTYSIRLEGRADGIILGDELITIDEIKGVYMDIYGMEEPVYVHLAQAMCYAYIYALQNDRKKMGIQMTYANLDTEDIRRFQQEYTFQELEDWFTELMERYRKWTDYSMKWRKARNSSMEGLEFPFPYRAGQRDLVSGVYRTIVRKKQLFIQAPTGVGKTMSTVFPAVRAVGEGYGEKIFYLTAKTITRTVAEEAFQILRGRGLKYKVVTITAKEKLCAFKEMECNPVHCPYAKGHYDRVNDAVYDMYTSEEFCSRDLLEEYADKWQVCPFEMCLDLSLWMDGVICDYNYVFDPNVHLQRFFSEGTRGDYIFLIDEAHNLVERGREMYSAALYKEDVLEAKRQMKNFSKKIERGLERVNKQMLEFKRECETYNVLEGIGNLPVTIANLQGEMEKFMEEHPDFDWPEESLQMYFDLRNFMNIYELVDENYVMYSELEPGGRFKMKLYCVNPAVNLQNCLDKGISAVFFSATLLPIQYYRSLFSTREDDYAMYAQSPFPPEKKCLLICRDVSSKYTRRGYEEYRRIASYINKTIRQKQGNYMVFFPSYRLLEDVSDIFEEEFQTEEIVCIRQNPSMRELEREEFLGQFRGIEADTLVGFCVMGGIFSEGIDLIGDSLIGVLVVGTGIPQVGYEREILKNYYDGKGRNGFDYAYRYPGMNKVLQSAGRVIRTDEDKGVILLLDERFLYHEYLQLFPAEWGDYQTCRLEDVEEKLERFW